LNESQTVFRSSTGGWMCLPGQRQWWLKS